MNPTVYALAAGATGVLALCRAVRLVVDDDYPPVERLRRWFVTKAGPQWGQIVECPWCAAPYLAAPAVAYAGVFVAHQAVPAVVWSWWLLNGWAAASWLAAFVSLRDIPADSR